MSSNTSSSRDVESLQSAVKGRAFLFDRSALSSRVVDEGDVTEVDEDEVFALRPYNLDLKTWKESLIGKL